MKRLLVLLIAYLAASLGAGACLIDRAIHRPRTALTASDHASAAGLAASLGAALETVSAPARDGATLQGWHFTPNPSTADTVILLHGITSNRGSLLPWARTFVAQGYRALALDGRGHGDSGGDLVTFGALESGDLRDWIAWVRRRAPGGCVFLLGDSLGAAVALQAVDAPGVCGVVAQSAFASLREIAFDRVGQQLHTGTWAGRSLLRPGIELGLLYARLRYGLDLGGASALAAVSRPGPPVLAIHGELDDNAPVRHVRILGQANPARVTTFVLPGGTHEGLAAGRLDYDSRLLEFLARARKPW